MSKVLKIILGTVIGLVITFFLAIGLDIWWISSLEPSGKMGHPIPAVTLLWFAGIPVTAAISAIITAIIVFIRDKHKKN